MRSSSSPSGLSSCFHRSVRRRRERVHRLPDAKKTRRSPADVGDRGRRHDLARVDVLVRRSGEGPANCAVVERERVELARPVADEHGVVGDGRRRGHDVRRLVEPLLSQPSATESGSRAVGHRDGYAKVRETSRPNIGHSHSSDAGSGASDDDGEPLSSSLLHAAANETSAATVHASAIERCFITVPPIRAIVHTRRGVCRGSLAVVRVLLSALRCEKGAVPTPLRRIGACSTTRWAAECALALFPEMSLTGSVDPAVHPERLITLDDASVSDLVACKPRARCRGGVRHRRTSSRRTLHHAGRRGRRRSRGRAAEAPSRRGRGGLPVRRRRPGVRRRRRALRHCDLRRGPNRPADSRSRRPRAPGWCAFRPRLASTAGARPKPGGALGWDWWCGDALGDARRHAHERGLWIAIATQAGSTADEDFPGLAALVDPQGVVVDQLPDWSAADLVVEVPDA